MLTSGIMEKLAEKKFMKEEVKTLKVRFWYEGIVMRTGRKSAYALENLFEQKSLNGDGETLSLPKKWPRYKRGAVAPCSDQVDSIDRLIPGSKREINSLLWEILLVESMTLRRVGRYIDKLSPSVRSTMLSWKKSEVSKARNSVEDNQGRILVRIGTLDALAGLVLIWKIYVKENRKKDAEILVDLIYKSMFIVGVYFKGRGLSEAFFNIFDKLIFSKMEWEDSFCALSSDIYEVLLIELDDMAWHVTDESPITSNDQAGIIKQKIMYGAKGYDCKFAYRLPLVPNWKYGPPTRRQYQSGMLRQVQWLWGRIHVCNKVPGKFPLDQLWDDLESTVNSNHLFSWQGNR